MVKTRIVAACAECRTHWYKGLEPEWCEDAGHEHHEFTVHLHRSTVTLPDGTSVAAASFDSIDPYGRGHEPQYGLYLDPKWQPPWIHDHVGWPDFGVPANPDDLINALSGALERARQGQRVEIGCHGGHGRTGTALACLAVLVGHSAANAVAWVRANYCTQAVETPEQEAFVMGLDLSRRTASGTTGNDSIV